MKVLRWLRCFFRGHDRICGICIVCYRGPQGERLIPISGGEGEDLFEFASDIGSGAEAAQFGGDLATGARAGLSTATDIAKDSTPWYSGLTDFASKLGSGIGREFSDSPLSALTKTLGIGATGMGIGNQLSLQKQIGAQTKNIEQGRKMAMDAAAPATAFGTETLNRAAGGNLSGPMQSQIDQWVAQKKADVRSRFAAMGLGNSTELNKMDQLIDQQAMAMKGQMLTQQEETGLAGINVGVGAATGSMGISQQQQQTLMQLIGEADKALGQMAGRSA